MQAQTNPAPQMGTVFWHGANHAGNESQHGRNLSSWNESKYGPNHAPKHGSNHHPGMNQMALGPFMGMSVPPGTMPPNVNPSMNQTVCKGCRQTNCS